MSNTYHHGQRQRDKHPNTYAIYSTLLGEYVDYGLCYREPKWWRKMMKHKRQRQRTRAAIYHVMLGRYDDKSEWVKHIVSDHYVEEVLFPLDRKPRI